MAESESANVRWEAEEEGRASLDLRGQFNRVAEAVADAGATGEPWRILDSFHYTLTPPLTPDAILYDAQRFQSGVARGDWLDVITVGFWSLNRTTTERDTGGAVKPMIVPGDWWFAAWYGDWIDRDGDGKIRYVSGAANEWTPLKGRPMVGFVDPGTWNGVDHATWPRASPDNEPDFQLAYEAAANIIYVPGAYNIGQGYPGVTVDGTLLMGVEVTTVADAILAPDENGRPYRETAGTMVDIDRYVAATPAPVEKAYADTAYPLRESAFATATTARTPREAGPAVATLRAPYPHETDDPRSGNHYDYAAGYHAWLDLLAVQTVPFGLGSSPQPLAAVGPNGEGGVLPGGFGVIARLGLWNDGDGDGWIGSVPHRDDPYESGARDDPNDYDHPRGEFVGYTKPKHTFTITLTPTGAAGWGPFGVYRYDHLIGTPADPLSRGHPPILDGPITIRMDAYVPTPGLYLSKDALFFPNGNRGVPFSIESSVVAVEFTSLGQAGVEETHDVDDVAGW